ncbi:MAG: menaquinone biosynthesis decarboxylase [Lentimicrobiaceae bacterium]|jgi:4-hydroxy-3-polyprenylbenzoate decarboxylase
MSYPNLQAFIQSLEREGELIRIKDYVSPHLQITEIADRMSKNNGKALLFENNGTKFPLLINSMGSERRICLALGVRTLDDTAKQIEELMAGLMTPRDSFLSKLALLPTLAEVAKFMPGHRKGKGACQEVVMETPDLSQLPVLTCWPFDGGPFITLPVVHTHHPETGVRNVGMYRMQVFGSDKTGMHWHLHKNSAAHYREYKRLGLKMPVAVALGGDPVYTYCATAPMPENIDEYMLAGFLRKKKVELVKCLTSDIEVPADADFIIEGYVDPAEDLILEGPFGDHTGFYSLADDYPVFHVTCITHRKDAVYPTTVVGIPPQEDKWLGKATERIFLPLIKLSMLPEIVDMVMPDEGVFHNIVLVKIRKTYPGQAQKVMNSLWGAGQMMFNKILIVTDADIDLNNSKAVARLVCDQVHPFDNIIFNRGPVDVLDHSSSRFALGSKLGIDATLKLTGEPEFTKAPVFSFNEKHPELEDLNCNFKLTNEKFPVLIIGIDKTKTKLREMHQRLFDKGALTGIHWVIYVDPEAVGIRIQDIIWLVANNIDPIRDCFYVKADTGLQVFPMAIDGTGKSLEADGFKRQWPNVLVMDDATIKQIDTLWDKLGLGKFIPSPSLNYKVLVKNEGAVARE